MSQQAVRLEGWHTETEIHVEHMLVKQDSETEIHVEHMFMKQDMESEIHVEHMLVKQDSETGTCGAYACETG
jgi:hypothetical protein